MSTLLIKNTLPFIGGKLREAADILIENNKIKKLLPPNSNEFSENVLDAKGQICVSGFIDIHTHGGYGHDIMEATETALESIAKFHLDNGTTTISPTTLTASIPDTEKALRVLSTFKTDSGARMLGAHLEGPYLSPKAAGAHPQNLLLTPDKINTAFIKSNASCIGRITIAPDLNNTDFLCKLCVDNGIQVSLGHDCSIDDEINLAIALGANSVTHLYNCTSRPSRRTTPKKHLGLTEIGLIDERLTVEVIADNRHVPNALFNMIFKLKGADKIVLVSDSLSVAGSPVGEYFIGSGGSKQVIKVDDGVATLPSENTYAGSVTPLSKMIVNLYKNVGLDLNDCLKMATLNPAKLMGLDDRGDIFEGALADLNILDCNGNVSATVFNGKIYKQ